MGWSTRELAELAGTTVRAVRHYHEVGLLDEPERRANGYKQYGVTHLVRVLRIKRLIGLGFSLSQIAEMKDTDDHPEEALRALDTELAETIARLQKSRDELAVVLDKSAPTDLPAEIAASAAGMEFSDADRSLIVVMSGMLGPAAIEAYAEALRKNPEDHINAAFDALLEDADERTRQALAEEIFERGRRLKESKPELFQHESDAPHDAQTVAHAIDKAIEELYNPAQVDVLRRVRRRPQAG